MYPHFFSFLSFLTRMTYSINILPRPPIPQFFQTDPRLPDAGFPPYRLSPRSPTAAPTILAEQKTTPLDNRNGQLAGTSAASSLTASRDSIYVVYTHRYSSPSRSGALKYTPRYHEIFFIVFSDALYILTRPFLFDSTDVFVTSYSSQPLHLSLLFCTSRHHEVVLLFATLYL